MKITYYEIGYNGSVYERCIDTENKNYVSHTDNDVTFKDTYTDQYWEEKEHIVTHSRLFETVRQERVNAYKKEIARYQKDLAVFENAKSYENYRQLQKYNLTSE